jgi:hypothetical protein
LSLDLGLFVRSLVFSLVWGKSFSITLDVVFFMSLAIVLMVAVVNEHTKTMGVNLENISIQITKL